MSPTNAMSQEAPAKKTTKPKEAAQESEPKPVETSARPIPGSGETPTGPPKSARRDTLKKQKERPPKPSSGTVADNAPKKNAQRAKGSISLNKTIEHPSTEKLQGAKCEAAAKEESATPTPAPPQRRKKKRDVEKKPATVKSKPLVVEPSFQSIEVNTLEVATPTEPAEPAEVKSEEIRPVPNSSFNSCSFFEKLQQGVKAYFSSRNSFNPEDRNKKEGGIRKCGSGVKEDLRKSNPGFKLKNKISYSDSDSLHSYNSILGEQSSTPSCTKSRNFRRLKRKKLYHPKKCYVKIQIPRRGYFYRSSVRVRKPENPSANPSRARGKRKAKPAGNTARPAPAKGASSDKEAFSSPSAREVFAPPCSNRLLSEFEGSNFEQGVDKYGATNWPESKRFSFEGTVDVFELPCPNGKTKPSVVSDDEKTKNGWNLFEAGDDFPSGLEVTCDPKLANIVDPRNGTSEGCWDALINCLSKALGGEQLVYNLEIGQVSGPTDAWVHCDANPLETINEEPLPLVDVLELQDLGLQTVRGSLVPPTALCDPAESAFPAFLMGGIDLHLELQNYLRNTEFSKGRTDNNFRCNSHNNYIPLKLYSSREDLQKRAEEFYDVAENKSGSSFDTASSDCPELEEVTNEMLLDVRCSDPQIENKSDDLRKAESKDDPGELCQEWNLQNAVKRTDGWTSFGEFRLDGKTTWCSPPWRAPPGKLHGENTNDDYEIIKPFGENEPRRRSKSSFLFQSSAYSPSAESVPQSIRKVASDTQSLAPSPVTPAERQLLKGPSNSEMVLPPHPPQPQEVASKWLPSLQQLIDIYNGVLKQNKKYRRHSESFLSRNFSSHILSYLNNKLTEKHHKSQLINRTEDIRNSHTPPNLKKPKRQDAVELEEYVGMFQEILESSLSINQIVRLNNIMAGFQEYSEKNYSFVKEWSEAESMSLESFTCSTTETETETDPEPVRREQAKPEPVKPEPVKSEPPKPAPAVPPICSQTAPPAKTCPRPGKICKPSTPTAKQVKTKNLPKAKPKSKPKSRQKAATTPPATANNAPDLLPEELQSILNLCFRKTKKETNGKNKILVTVNLCGNQLVVNGFNYFDNESALLEDKTIQNGTSELIIENLTKEEVKKRNWNKNAMGKKVTVLKPVPDVENNGKIPFKKPKQSTAINVKKQPRPKSVKVKGRKPRAVKPKAEKPQTRRKESESKPPQMKGPKVESKEIEKDLMHFEYDQMQLRVQHPIEAIAETSESKVSQQMENLEDGRGKTKLEPPPQTKSLLQDTHITPLTMKETLKAALAKKVFSKDLTRDFSWRDEIGKVINRAASCEFRPQAKRPPTPKKKHQAARVRSMFDLKKKQPCGIAKSPKTCPHRPQSSYMCYSSTQRTQGQSSHKRSPTGQPSSLSPSPGIPKTKGRPPSRSPSPAAPKAKGQPSDEHVKKASRMTSKEAELKPKALVSPTLKPTDSEELCVPVPAETLVERLTATTSTESDLMSDSCGVEFLFSENRTLHSIEGDFTRFGKEPEITTPLDCTIQQQNFFTGEESKSLDNSPFVILRESSNDCNSFVTEMIHSDSFLVDFPLNISQSKMRSLFKSNSDIKFYPGRLTESGIEESPLVTFVLTPSQNEEAKLPANQVKVVGRRDDVDSHPSDDGKNKERKDGEIGKEEGEEKNSLKSIEEFINHLSKCRKATLQKKLRDKNRVVQNKTSAPTCTKKKPVTRSCSSNLERNQSKRRPPLHEPLKRRMVNANRKDRKGGSTTPPKKENRKEIGTGNQDTSDLFLHKMINNLLQALENLPAVKDNNRESEEKKEVSLENGVDDTAKEDPDSQNKNVKYSLTGMSHSPKNIHPAVLTAIKAAIKQADAFAHKEEVIAALEEAFPKSQNNQMEDLDSNAKLKIKIHCNEEPQKEETEKPEKVTEERAKRSLEIDLLDSMVSWETPDGNDLRRRNSMYFDATEKTAEDNIGGDGERMNDSKIRPTAEGTLNLNTEFGVAEDKPKSCLLTPSDTHLLSRDVLEKESEDIVLDKISKSLEEGKIAYSMELLGGFLSKAESSDCNRLKKLLQLVESKSKSIMMDMEKTAWLKVLSLVEEVTRVLNSDDIDDSVKARLKSTKGIIEKIQSMNMKRLIDLKKFYSTFTQQSKQVKDNSGNVLDKIKNVLKHLTRKLMPKRSSRSLENDAGGEMMGNESGIKLHSTISLPEIREDGARKPSRGDDPQYLKRKLRDQYFYMQQLVKEKKHDYDFLPVEIQSVRRQVAEKMKVLKKAFEVDNPGESSRSAAESLSKATELLKLADSYRTRNGGSSAGKVSSSEVKLNRTSGYADLVKCMIKAWDTRLTVSSITSECFT